MASDPRRSESRVGTEVSQPELEDATSLIEIVAEALQAALAKSKASAAATKALADPEWVSRGISAVRREADAVEPLAPVATAGLDYLASNRDAVAKVAAGTFMDVVHHLALGRDAAAERVFLAWLETTAAAEERTSARLDAARGVVVEEDASHASWAATKALAIGFIEAAGKAALPILAEVLKGAVLGAL